MVEIKVGPENRDYGNDIRSFYMHKGILSFYSGYFQGAVKGGFRDTNGDVITLEAVRPRTFEMFQGWAYSNQIRGLTEDKEKIFFALVDLWLFADQHLIPMLQNQTVDLYRAKFVEYWWCDATPLPRIYEQTALGSGLRRFVVDILVHTSYRWTDYQLRNYFPKATLVDFVLKLQEKPPAWHTDDVTKLDMCGYHVHEDGVRCETST